MPGNAKSMLARANSYFEKGSPERALLSYKLVCRLTENKALLRVLYPKIARTHAALKRHDEAIYNYQEAIKYSSPHEHANILVEIGRLHQSNGNYRQAVRRYREALGHSSQPDSVGDVLYWLGESLYKVPEIDKNDESLKLLEEAKSKPRKLILIWEIHNTKGHALKQKQHFEEALEEFDKALNEDLDLIDIPGNIYNSKAGCLEAMKKKNDEAIHWYREAIRAPRSQYDTKGCAHMRIGALYRDSHPHLAQKEIQEAKKLFKIAKDHRDIPGWYADKFLDDINKLLDDVEQKLESVTKEPKRVPSIEFKVPVTAKEDITVKLSDLQERILRVVDKVYPDFMNSEVLIQKIGIPLEEKKIEAAVTELVEIGYVEVMGITSDDSIGTVKITAQGRQLIK